MPNPMKTVDVHARFLDTPCPPENAFRFANGSTAASLVEFRARIVTEPLDVVAFHRTHYAAWLADVIGDAPLAERARRLGDSEAAPGELRATLASLVDARVRELRSQPAVGTRQPIRKRLFG
ncbi:MAG: hypothetical protein ACYDCK_11290 [Thermoplasmatota archaeon]